MFSKSCEYALKAIIYIATHSLDSKRVKIGDVATNTNSPHAFTAKIMGTLNKHNIVNSVKGPYGGFEIDNNRMKQIKISEIVSIIDGDSIYNGCGLGLSECDANAPCPLHEHFVSIRSELKYMLERTSIFDLATKLKAGESTLLR